MTGRQVLDDIGRAVLAARRLRSQPLDTFDDIDPADLERAARGLLAVAVDCRFGADLLERAIAQRAADVR